MVKPKTTIQSRCKEYASKGMVLFGESQQYMRCKYCDCRVDWTKKDSVDKHIHSKTHLAAEERSVKAGLKRQLSLDESNDRAKRILTEKELFKHDVVEAFMEANIPLEKLEHPALQRFFKKYLPGSGDIPCVRTAREKYIPLVAEKRKEEVKDALQGKDIVEFSDEAEDKAGRCIYNILFQTLEPSTEQQLYLASSSLLDAANAANCCKAFLKTLDDYGKSIEEVQAFVADSARCMNKCFRTLQSLNEELLHIQCWPHKLHHCGQTWQFSLPDLNQAIMNTKKLFLHARKRKNQYLAFLSKKYPDQPKKWKHFPLPVITRWYSWKKSVDYIYEYFDDICEFVNEMYGDENVDSDSDYEGDDEDEAEHSTHQKRLSKGVKGYLNLSQTVREKIAVFSEFVSIEGQELQTMIQVLQRNKSATAHLVYENLDNVERRLNVISTSSTRDVIIALQKIPTFSALTDDKKKSYVPVLIKATRACRQKLIEFGSKDPARDFFVSLESLLGLKNLGLSQLPLKNIEEHMKKIPYIRKLPVTTFAVGQRALMDLVACEKAKPNFQGLQLELLCTLKDGHKTFADACLRAIWFPTGNSNSERSISDYNNILTDRRRNLKPENAESLSIVYFNGHEKSCYDY